MKTKLYIIIAIAVSILPACKQSKQNNQQTATKLSIGIMSSLDYLPLAIAQQQGYFADNGVEVTLHKFYSANERDAALQAGSLDATILDYTGGALQRAGGIELRFASQCDATFVLMAGETSGINSTADMDGKNIAVSRNTVIDFCTDAALQQAGLDESRITKSEINKIPLRLEMLRNAKIDATALPDPFATIARSSGAKPIVSMQELGYKVTGIAFLQKAIDEKGDAIRRFYTAYNQAIDDLLKNQVSHFADVLTQEVGFPENTIDQITLPPYTKASKPNMTDLQATVDWLAKKELIPHDFDTKSLIADDLLP